MEKKYTRGPWKVKKSETKPTLNIIGTALGSKYKIARCPIEDFGPKYPEINKAELIEVEANAKLISAAPELLEACIKAKESMLRSGITYDNADQWNILNNAIKKATE